MDQIILGAMSVTVGCWVMFHGRQEVPSQIEYQNKTFGFRFGKKEIEAGKRGVPLVATVFIVIGLLGIAKGLGWLQ